MAREKMVTRTFTVSQFTVMSVNIATSAVETKSYTIPGDFDEKTALKHIVESCDDSNIKPVAIIGEITKTEELYGMTEREFIAAAHKLPPRKVTE